MRKILILLLAISFYPFGCEAQVNGTLPNDDSCDTIFIENPAWDAEKETFNQMIARLTEEVQVLTDNNVTLTATIATMTTQATSKDKVIVDLNERIDELEVALEAKPDTIYKDVIVEVEVMPSPTVDTVYVTHSNDDKTNRKFFHHRSFEAPYPKDITFETKELCMITVEFPDSLGTYRTLDRFKVKRIMDHENARTIYEFIE